MKNWQFITIIILIVVGFSILYYQNRKIYDYLEVLERRQIDIYKNTWGEPDKELSEKLDYISSDLQYIEVELEKIKKEL